MAGGGAGRPVQRPQVRRTSHPWLCLPFREELPIAFCILHALKLQPDNSAAGQMALAKVRKLQEQNAELTRRLEAGTSSLTSRCCFCIGRRMISLTLKSSAVTPLRCSRPGPGGARAAGGGYRVPEAAAGGGGGGQRGGGTGIVGFVFYGCALTGERERTVQWMTVGWVVESYTCIAKSTQQDRGLLAALVFTLKKQLAEQCRRQE